MKNIRFLLIALLIGSSTLKGFSAVNLSEDFTDGPSTYTTGFFTYDSGNTWELANILGTSDARYQLNVNAFIISPSVNTIGTISFKYKEGNTGGGTFTVSKSIDGGAFTVIESQAFAGTTFSQYSVTINDLNSNIRIKVSANAGSQLIIDDFEITDYIPGNELITSTPSLSGFDYFFGDEPSSTKYFDLSGVLLSGYPGNILVTAPTNYKVSLDNSSFSNSVNVAYSSATLASTRIYVMLNSGLSIGTYNGNISISGGGADDVFVSCSGSVTAMPPPAVYVAPTSLSGFSYVFGTGPSNVETYQLYGNYLIDYPNSISVNAPSHYEISLDNSTFTSSLSVTYDNLNLPSTTIYVRLKSGLSIGNYNSESITNVSSSYGTKTVSCSGTVDPLPPDPSLYVTPSILNGLDYIVGSGPSTPQIYNLSGANFSVASGNISVTAPTNYEISLSSGSGYAASLNIPYSSATLGSTPIYVRLKAGLSVGTYNSEIIANAGGGATTVNVTCNGSVEDVPPPSLVVNPTNLNGFTYIEGNGPSSYQSYSISGTYLTGFPGSITISAPTNYEISLSSGSGYTNNIDVPHSSASLANTVIYVRLKSELNIGTYNSEIITNAGGGASTVNITCNGNVTDVPPPTLQVSTTSLSGFAYTEGNGPSAAQSYSLSGTYLTGFPANITVNAPTNYEISLSSGSGFTNTLTIPYATATLSSTSIYVRLKSDLPVGTYNSEFITNSGGGAVDIDVACNGSVSAVSTDPCLEEDFSGFTAGTHASPNSTDISSSLDSYTQTTGWTGLKVYSAGGEIKLGSASAVGYIITPTIDLSTGGTLEFDYAKWNSDNSMIQIFHASDGVNFVQVGSDISTTDDFQTHSVEITGGTSLSKIKIGGTDRIYLDNIVIYCGGSAPTPALTANPTSLSGFYYTVGSGPSAEQSFVVSGTDLDGTNVIVIPPANYEISEIPIGGFQSSAIVLSSFNGSDRSIFVRLKENLDVGTYNSDIITISGGGAADVTVSLNGEVLEEIVPELFVNPTELNVFNYIEGFGPSAEQSFILSGTDLNGTNVTVTPPTNYEISLSSGTSFQSTPILLSAYNGSAQTIYVRLKANLDFGIYNLELITVSGGSADDVTVELNGYVDEFVNVVPISNAVNFEIYPNPVTDYLNVMVENWKSDKINWEIVNTTGQVVLTGNFNPADSYFVEQINMSGLKPDMYVVRFMDDDNLVITKVDKK
ncbi:MAG: T9SS type A sorting domain-containing protein [Bacteroidales bacterium]|nr:T9SS type A sorting domain-containing protein [Bacteroidales bacterium]